MIRRRGVADLQPYPRQRVGERRAARGRRRPTIIPRDRKPEDVPAGEGSGHVATPANAARAFGAEAAEDQRPGVEGQRLENRRRGHDDQLDPLPGRQFGRATERPTPRGIAGRWRLPRRLERNHVARLWVCGSQDVVPDAGPVYFRWSWHGLAVAGQTS